VNGATLRDADYFVISDGLHSDVYFEFDIDGQGVRPGYRRISISATAGVFAVASAIGTAINLAGDELAVTAHPNGSTVVLINDEPGALGNVVAHRVGPRSGVLRGGDVGRRRTRLRGWNRLQSERRLLAR